MPSKLICSSCDGLIWLRDGVASCPHCGACIGRETLLNRHIDEDDEDVGFEVGENGDVEEVDLIPTHDMGPGHLYFNSAQTEREFKAKYGQIDFSKIPQYRTKSIPPPPGFIMACIQAMFPYMWLPSIVGVILGFHIYFTSG